MDTTKPMVLARVTVFCDEPSHGSKGATTIKVFKRVLFPAGMFVTDTGEALPQPVLVWRMTDVRGGSRTLWTDPADAQHHRESLRCKVCGLHVVLRFYKLVNLLDAARDADVDLTRLRLRAIGAMV